MNRKSQLLRVVVSGVRSGKEFRHFLWKQMQEKTIDDYITEGIKKDRKVAIEIHYYLEKENK